MNTSVYKHVLSLGKRKIAFVDIDSTLSSHIGDTTISQFLDPNLTNMARSLLETKGYVTAFVTSRTEEMLMSKPQYDLSVEKYHFTRPVPHLAVTDNKKGYLPPEECEPLGILDPEIISSSTGAKIFTRQKNGGYAEDTSYRTSTLPPQKWRKKTMTLLRKLHNNEFPFTFSSVEHESGYFNGVERVFPPDFRIQILFQNSTDLVRFQHIFSSSVHDLFAINDSWPQKDMYALYICTSKGKYEAVDRITHMMPPETEILIVGDSLTDLYEGIYSECKSSTLFLVGGSRISPYLSDPNRDDFAGENLSEVKKYIRKIGKGGYIFEKNGKICNLIISDEKYPGLVGPESIIEYLS